MLNEFLEWLKEETLTGVWSKGVALSRNSKSVEKISASLETNELKFKILTTERVLAFQVTLWLKEQDAFCNCDSKVEPCHHVVAVALALQNGLVQEPGANAAAPTLRYTWLAESGGMNPLRKISLRRELVVNGNAKRLEGSLVSLLGGIQSGRVQMAAPSTTSTDLKLDEIYAKANPTWNEVFKVIAELPPLPAEGFPVAELRTNSKPVLRELWIEDAGNGAFHIKEKIAEERVLTEKFQGGIFLSDDTLYLQDNSLIRFEPKTLDPGTLEPFLRETLPKLREDFEVSVRSEKFPVGETTAPALEFEVQALQDEFAVTARLGYPVLPPGRVALRSLPDEQRLLKILREELHLKLGAPVKLDLKSALELRTHLLSTGLQSSALDRTLHAYFEKEAGLTLEQALAEEETLLKLLELKDRAPKGKPVFLDMLRCFSESSLPGLGKTKPSLVRPELWEKLRDYQKIGVDWLETTRNRYGGAILADDMGLGKTVQTLAVLKSPSLVVVPTSLLQNWKEEAARFRPDLRVQIYHGPNRQWQSEADLTVTTYALLRLEPHLFKSKDWETVVLDEAHFIRNADTQAAVATFRLEAKSRIALTGTPIQNRKSDLLSLFHFVRPGMFHAESELEPKLIAPFLLRRTKDEVLKELPPKTYLEHSVEFTPQEKKFYDTVWSAARAEVVSKLGSEKLSPLTLFEVLLRARQACNHRALVDPDQMNEPSSKVEEVIALVEELLSSGQSVLLYSQWTQFLNRLEQEIKTTIPYLRLDGSTRDRAGVIEAFQKNPMPTVFLLSLHAGGVGLNLTKASQVIFCEPWWNPFVELQAEDRAYRMGQEKPVTIHRLITLDSVEEKMRLLQKEKLALGEAAFLAEDLEKLI